MSDNNRVPLSVLDLAPVPQSSVPRDAFATSLALAQQAENQGWHRYWLAEHHNMTGIASAATSVLIGFLAANTIRLRLGAGGIMLPNHAPLVIAEQFGTLETLYPGRIDLGLGRAPGSDQRTMLALRRQLNEREDSFPNDVSELLNWFDADKNSHPPVQPVPGLGLQIPVWLLGSSLYSARLAAQLGLPFAFASHFAPEMLMQALQIYRQHFTPSARLEKPYAMVCVNVIAAESEPDARFLFTSMQQQFLNLRRGKPGPLPPPTDDIETLCAPGELYGVHQALSMSVVGNRQQVANGLRKLQQQTGADEIMVNGQIFEPAARLRSFEIAMQAHHD